MGSRSFVNQSDTSLLPFFKASNGAEAEEWLAVFIAELTETTVKKVIRNKLHVSLSKSDDSQRNQEALDIVSDVQALLISQLRDFKSQDGFGYINNFRNYTASVTINACHQYLRQKYPLRYQLKYKLRYLLTHQQSFALWQNEEGDWICGFEKWRFQTKQPVKSIRDIEDIKSSLSNAANRIEVNERALYLELLTEIFIYFEAPIILDELVSLVIKLRGIKENTEIAETGELAESRLEQIADSKTSVSDEIEQRERLQKLWKEICLLPVRHRAALLLNLKDKSNECVITFLPLLRIATIRQIAETLDFSPEEFAEVWKDLPWDDLAIAGHLGVTRQQVINLRQSARARLFRVTKDL